MSPPAPAPHPTPSPAPTSPPPRSYEQFDVWNPGGHPDVLIHAAQAWRTLAAALRAIQKDLERQVSRLKAGWTGTASDGFQAWGGQLAHSLTDSAEQCDRVAGQLDEVAVRVRSTNDQVRERYLAIGVTVAAGVAFTVMTLGVSDAAAGATMTAEATEAASVVATLTTFFNSLLGRWVVAFGINLVATGVEKAWVNPDHNPVGGWEPGDLTHALLGADALAVAAPIAEAIPGFKAFRVAHPFRSAAVVSGSAAGTAAFASDLSAFGFEGKPLGLETLIDVGVSAGGSGVISGAAEWGAARFVTKPPPLASVDSVLSKAKVGDSLEALGFGVREAHEPHGWARSESGLLVPVTGESGSVDLITPRTTLPKLAGIRPDEWEKGPGGLLVPEPGASHPALVRSSSPSRATCGRSRSRSARASSSWFSRD